MRADETSTHVILTRFNLDTPGREEKYRRQDGWLENRFALFEKYSLPSIVAQTCQDFVWHVLFSDQTPNWARDRVATAQAKFPFHAHFTPLFGPEGWGEVAASHLFKRSTIIVTTNLDSDDALSNDFVARVRSIVCERPPAKRYAINFQNGYVRSGPFLYEHLHSANAFSTLVERLDEPLVTTCGILHMEISRYVDVVQDGGPPAWLQVVHGGNVSNVIRGKRTSQFECDRFPVGVASGLDLRHGLALTIDRFVLARARYIRDRILIAVRRVFPAAS